jgi:hypothetical protein
MLSCIASSEGSNSRPRNVLLYTKKLAFTGLVKATVVVSLTHIATGEGPEVCPVELKL